MKEIKSLYIDMYGKGKLMLLHALVLTTIFSCSKKEFQAETKSEAAISVESATSTTVSPNLIYEETFEQSTFFPLSGNSLNLTEGIENCNDKSTDPAGPEPWTLSNNYTPFFQGSKAAHFEVRKDQPLVGSSQRIRSEVTIIKGSEDSRFTPDAWYSYAMMIPAKGGEPDYRLAINQWFEDGSSELTTRTDNGYAYLELENGSNTTRWDLFSTAKNGASNTGFKLYPVDEWHEFVFHIIHSLYSDGLIQVWRDGVKIHEYTGPTIHLKMPKWKIGLYASSKMTAANRVIYFDNVRVGKKGTTLADMVSGSTPPPPPTPSNIPPTANAGSDITITLPVNTVSLSGKASDSDGSIASLNWTKVSGADGFSISSSNTLTPTISNLKAGSYTFRLTVTDNKGATATDDVSVKVNDAVIIPGDGIMSFVLVDAATEKDVMTITDGASISLNKYGLTKVNIRANTSDPSIATVVFQLSGAETKTTKDKAAPFALMGDDGKGNYYYGSWNPPTLGNYTLTATPYADRYATGTPGTTSLIHFTITN